MLNRIISKIFSNRKIQYLLLITFLFSSFPIYGTLLRVAADGSQDYTSIQTAINETVNGDTVLVYPGTYYENLDFLGKSITLGSLTLTTNDQSYINQTVIDGNQNGTCITVENSDEFTVCGFLIQNGSSEEFGGGLIALYSNGEISNNIFKYNKALRGAGIYLNYSDCTISYNQIHNNYSLKYGGGIYNNYSQIILKKNSIRFNKAALAAGGYLFYGDTCETIFDTNDLNSLYANYAAIGSDIIKGMYTPNNIEVIVDTFTVDNPSFYYMVNAETGINDLIFSNQHSYYEQINQDLYVSADGDDNNSGLSPHTSLKSLHKALMQIKADSLNPLTIHLADGIYSHSSGQLLPLQMKEYVSLIGESKENTIIDCEYQTPAIITKHGHHNNSLKNMTITGTAEIGQSGYHGIYISNSSLNENASFEMKNIDYSDNDFGILINQLSGMFLNNRFFNNNNRTLIENGQTVLESPICTIIKNSNLEANNSRTINMGNKGTDDNNRSKCFIINSNISDNFFGETDWDNQSSGISFFTEFTDINIINTTIADNSVATAHGGGISIRYSHNNSFYIRNSILHGNSPSQIRIVSDFNHPQTNLIDIDYSLIENGQNGISNWYEEPVEYGDNNMQWEPAFNTENEQYPYSLTATSPCIDAGTLDLPEGVELPETDLAGNPRIVGDAIDMGAYEYQGSDIADETAANPEEYKLNVYPNPYQLSDNNSVCHIWFEIPDEGETEIAIYNIKGQKVRTLVDSYTVPGEHSLRWYGVNDADKPVASGTYFIRFRQNGTVKTRKMLVLK